MRVRFEGKLGLVDRRNATGLAVEAQFLERPLPLPERTRRPLRLLWGKCSGLLPERCTTAARL